ncbi:MAG: hypothetical protein A2252_07055 [Elusimicrobia bacterium RIFOXYA2_FULL_39_19]|nr:MAG: hypothetical protein A2252_07055 [Elusimicrobia bacterium RIFOXYA2_FULL_39_19]
MQKDILIAAIILIISFGAGYVLRHLVFKLLTKWAKKTTNRIDDIIISAIKTPFLFWSVLLGISFTLRLTSVPGNVTAFLDKLTIIIWVVSITLVISKIIVELIKAYSDKLQQTNAFPVTTLTQNVTSIAIFIVAILIILNLLGISIAPIITALGIGGLAVALALQETLSNLFAGIYTILAKQIRVGDYIQLESGQEGYVLDIGWRSTRIRALPNNIVVIPNSKLSQTIVTNYYQPEKELAILVNLGVDYSSDLEKVERVTIEVGQEIMKTITGGIPDFQPFIRYNKFDNSSVNFTVILRGKEFVDKYLIIHEFMKSLHKRYAKENITIPFPIRTLHLKKD